MEEEEEDSSFIVLICPASFSKPQTEYCLLLCILFSPQHQASASASAMATEEDVEGGGSMKAESEGRE